MEQLWFKSGIYYRNRPSTVILKGAKNGETYPVLVDVSPEDMADLKANGNILDREPTKRRSRSRSPGHSQDDPLVVRDRSRSFSPIMVPVLPTTPLKAKKIPKKKKPKVILAKKRGRGKILSTSRPVAPISTLTARLDIDDIILIVPLHPCKLTVVFDYDKHSREVFPMRPGHMSLVHMKSDYDKCATIMSEATTESDNSDSSSSDSESDSESESSDSESSDSGSSSESE